MGYEIIYGWAGTSKHISRRKCWIMTVRTAMLVLGACGLLLWTIGGDWSVTVHALEEMANQLHNGSDVKDAFSTFCIEVLDGA